MEFYRHLLFLMLFLIQNNDPGNIVTGPDETLYSHMLVFAAEKARKENKVVMMQPDGSFS